MMNPHVTYNSTPAASDHSPLCLFDRVLVRNRSDQPWMPRIFAGLHTETADDGREVCEVSHFQTTDGNYYLQCLPYEGREDWVFTCRNTQQDNTNWMPQRGDKYYVVCWSGRSEAHPLCYVWENYGSDLGKLSMGNCFRYESEAQKAADELNDFIKQLFTKP